MLTNFQKICTIGKRMKFATKPIRHYPPHLRHVATLCFFHLDRLSDYYVTSVHHRQQLWYAIYTLCPKKRPPFYFV